MCGDLHKAPNLKKRTATLQRPIDAKMHIQEDARAGGFQREEDYRPIEICRQILFAILCHLKTQKGRVPLFKVKLLSLL